MNVTRRKAILDIVHEFISGGMGVPGGGKAVGNFQHCVSGRCLVAQGDRL